MRAFFRKIFRWFLDGVIVIIPLALTVILVCYPLNMLSEWIASFTNKVFGFFLKSHEINLHPNEGKFFVFLRRYLNEDIINEFITISSFPYINLFLIVGLLTLFGCLSSSRYIQFGLAGLERLIVKIPILNLLYSYVKESTLAFIGKFNKPVIVTVNKELNIQKVGFITQENMKNLSNGNKKNDKVGVYMPHSYALSGELSLFSKENIKPANITATEAWKITLSGGLAKPTASVLKNTEKESSSKVDEANQK